MLTPGKRRFEQFKSGQIRRANRRVGEYSVKIPHTFRDINALGEIADGLEGSLNAVEDIMHNTGTQLD